MIIYIDNFVQGWVTYMVGGSPRPGWSEHKYVHLRIELAQMLDVPRVWERLPIVCSQPKRALPWDTDHGKGAFPHGG